MVFLDATEKTQAPFLRRALRGRLGKVMFDRSDPEVDVQANIRNFIVTSVEDVMRKGDKNLGTKYLVEFFSDLKPSTTDGTAFDNVADFINRTLAFNSTTGSYYVNANVTHPYTDASIETHFLAPLREQLSQISFRVGDIPEIRFKIVIKFYDEAAKGYSHRDHIAPMIKRMDSRIRDLSKVIRVETPDDGVEIQRNFTVVSLKDVSIHIRKIMPLLLCKNLYDEKKAQHDTNKYLNIIIDEAHNILSDVSSRESEQWKDYRLETFEEIIKEGRKFGVFLTIASQRPADISATIISQLHNYFLHRLINNKDITAVEKTISYLDKVSFEYLPILPTGTCILAGLVAQVPVVIDIDPIPEEYEPKNKTMTLIEKWEDPEQQ